MIRYQVIDYDRLRARYENDGYSDGILKEISLVQAYREIQSMLDILPIGHQEHPSSQRA
jgi:hypothetical protein